MNKWTALPTLALATAVAPSAQDSMADGLNGYGVSSPLYTIGETFMGTTGALNPTTAGAYTPVGVLDGMGAFELNATTVRLLANHELLNFRGYPYDVSDGQGGTFSMSGARVSYFDIDKGSRQIVDAGLAIHRVYDALGNVATDTSFLVEGFAGLSRLCSGQLHEAGTFGLVDTIYFAGEEDGGAFNPIGGAQWALDVTTGDLWQVPYMGHGAWENITAIETGNPNLVAFVLADDSSPFDFDSDGTDEAAPLYVYVGRKRPGNFLSRNGLAEGSLFVWVSDTGETKPSQFNTSGFLNGSFRKVDNARRPAFASTDGSTGFDEFGFPTQGNLWIQAEAAGAFGFSRPEDVATNPAEGTQVVLASTGVDTYDVDPVSGNGVDTFGTVYVLDVDPSNGSAALIIVYDGDADPTRALRSPDNLDWADDGFIYVQEDKAETDTLTGEVLFGAGAANPNEAGIVRISTAGGQAVRVANIDRSVLLDGSIAVPSAAVDTDAGVVGAWESSGIIDVSTLFGEDVGTLFLFNVQAHGIEDQDQFNATSRLVDGDLVEGGQLLFLEKN